MLLAIVQGLYNKNPKNMSDTIEETYNKITNKPYRIQIFFEKDESKYYIDNDRVNNKITIMENDVNISSKGIKQCLTKIEDIIGLNYNTFTSFYYLSLPLLQTIFDTSADSNLIYKFFDIEKLKSIEKTLKAQMKELKSDLALLNAHLKANRKQLDTLDSFGEINEAELLNQKSIYQENLLALQESREAKKITLLHNELNIITEQLAELKGEYKGLSAEKKVLLAQYKQFLEGKCPVCGSNVKDKTTDLKTKLDDIDRQIKQIANTKEELDNKTNSINNLLVELETAYKLKEKDYQNKIQVIDSKLLVYKQEAAKYEQIKQQSDFIKAEILTLEHSINEKRDLVSYITVALNIIKSNAITQEYLNSFVLLLNTKIKELSQMLHFDIDIIISAVKGKLKFKFIDNGIEKTLNSLSAGEKTRTAIITLFGVLESLQVLSHNKFNLLVLDELLGVLDEEGIELLKQLLQTYRDKMSVFVVLHHNEISSEYFDAIYKLTKINDITQVSIERNKNGE